MQWLNVEFNPETRLIGSRFPDCAFIREVCHLCAGSPGAKMPKQKKAAVKGSAPRAKRHICMICGFIPSTKNKYRELQDHLVRKHFSDRIKAALPTKRPYMCPEHVATRFLKAKPISNA